MVRVHPLAVVLVVAVGGFAAGIVGTLLAVPTAAVANAVVQYIAASSPRRSVTADPVTADPDSAAAVRPADGEQ
jgi:predicted PurR-regulated permease PerM